MPNATRLDSDVVRVVCLPLAGASRSAASLACRRLIATVSHIPDLRFSVSHASGMSVVALATGRRVGVDIERRRGVDVAAIEEMFFGGVRHDDFFAAWTRNEALVKATRLGLVFPADIMVPDAATLLVEALDLGPEYAATVAADGPAWRTTVTMVA